MPAKCRIVSTPDDLDEIAKNLQESKTMTAFLRRFPAFGGMIRTILGPAADLTKGSFARHVIGHAVLREERQASITASLGLLVDKPLEKAFTIDALQMTELPLRRSGKVVPVHMNDLIEGRRMYDFKLTPEQKAALVLRKGIWDDITFDYNRFGGKLDRESGLFPRIPMGRIDENGRLRGKSDIEIGAGPTGGARLKVTGGFTRARAMDEAGNIISAGDMTDKGWRYSAIDDALSQRAHEVGRSTADAQFTQWLTTRSDVLKKTDILGPGVKTGVYPAAVPAEVFGGPKGATIDIAPFTSEKMPALAGYYAPVEITKYVTELLSRPEHADIPIISPLAAESRGLIASFDIGTTGIQLLGALAADAGHFGKAIVTLNPKAASGIFPRAVAGSVKAMFDSKYLMRYYADNKPVIDRWSAYLGGLHNSEYFTNLQRSQETGSIIGRAAHPLHVAEKPFAQAFEAGLDIAKIEYIKALERIHPDLTRADMEALGGWVRNSTGVMSTSRLGISSRQQAAEAGFLFFSPRYTRSLFAMVGTVLKNDIAGQEARLAFGGMLVGGLSLYYGVTQELGQPMRLDPKKPGFLSIRVGNNWVGIGGGVRALTRLMVTSWDAARTNPKAFLSLETVGQDSNPFLSFWRSRMAPITGATMDIWKGEDFRGRPIEGVADWGRVLESRVLPFGIQAALEAKGQLQTKSSMAFLSGVGLNTNPMTTRQVLDEYLKGVTDATGTQRFPDGANTVETSENRYKEFLQADPYAQQLETQYAQDRLNGSHPGREIQQVLTDRSNRLQAAEDQLTATGDYQRYRSQVNTIRADSRKTMEDLHLDQTSGAGDKKTVSSWYDTYNDPRAIDPVTGGISSDGLEQAQAEWKLEHSGEYERLILPSETIGETPAETQLRQDRKTIDNAGWWDTDKQAWTQIDEMAGFDGKYKDYADYQAQKRQEYLKEVLDAGQPPELAGLRVDILMTKDPVVRMFNKLRTRERVLLQRENPGLTTLLSKWGYNSTSLREYQMAAAQFNSEGYTQ